MRDKLDCMHPDVTDTLEELEYLKVVCVEGKHVIVLTPLFRKTAALKVASLTDAKLNLRVDTKAQVRFYRKHLPIRNVALAGNMSKLIDPMSIKDINNTEPVCHLYLSGKAEKRVETLLYSILRDDLSVFVYREKSFERLYAQLFEDLQGTMYDSPKDYRRILHLFFDKSIGIQFKFSNKRQLYIHRVVEIADHRNNKLSTKVIYEYHESTKHYLKKG